MRINVLLLILVLTLWCSAYVEYADANKALPLGKLNENNFRKKLSASKALVFFTVSDICNQCQQVQQQMMLANAQLQHHANKAEDSQFYMVNCSEQDAESLCLEEFGIEGFPTILYVSHLQEYEEYKGNMNANKLVQFFNQRARGSVQKLPAIEDYLAFKNTIDGDEYATRLILHIPKHIEDALVLATIPNSTITPTQSLIVDDHFNFMQELIRFSQQYRSHVIIGLVNQTTVRQTLQNIPATVHNSITSTSVDLSLQHSTLSPTQKALFNETNHYKTYPTTNEEVYYLEIYRSFDQPYVEFVVKDFEQVQSIYLEHSLPRFGTITPWNYALYLQRNVPIVWIFYDFNNNKSRAIAEYNAIFNTVTASIKQNQLLFVKVDSRIYTKHASTFGIQHNTLQWPGIVIEDRFRRKNYIYNYSQPIQNQNHNNTQAFLNNLQAWFNEYLSSSLKHTLRSQGDDKYHIEENLYIKSLVGKHFENYLLQNMEKDIMIIFYASFCAQTPKLRHKFIDLLNNTNVLLPNDDGRSLHAHPNQTHYSATSVVTLPSGKTVVNNTLKYDQNLIIAQFDITTNDIPFHLANQLDIIRTPTLYFYPAVIITNETNHNSHGGINGGINNNTLTPITTPRPGIKYSHGVDTKSIYHFIATTRVSKPKLVFPSAIGENTNATTIHSVSPGHDEL